MYCFQVLQTKEEPTQSVSSTQSTTLAKLGRKLHPIQGDGNCFFRALSYIVYGTEDHPVSVQASVVLFSELNAEHFKKYWTSSSVKDHTQCMKQERVFATQMETHATASCVQRTVYIYTEKWKW